MYCETDHRPRPASNSSTRTKSPSRTSLQCGAICARRRGGRFLQLSCVVSTTTNHYWSHTCSHLSHLWRSHELLQKALPSLLMALACPHGDEREPVPLLQGHTRTPSPSIQPPPCPPHSPSDLPPPRETCFCPSAQCQKRGQGSLITHVLRTSERNHVYID